MVPNPTTWTGDGSVEPIPVDEDMILTPTPTFISVPISPSAATVFLNVSCANILNE